MKETKIAKESIKDYKENEVGILDEKYTKTLGLRFICKTHKQTLQRWLDYLILTAHPKVSKAIGKRNFFKEKIKDLKQAIKLYEENGI